VAHSNGCNFGCCIGESGWVFTVLFKIMWNCVEQFLNVVPQSATVPHDAKSLILAWNIIIKIY
jgi:hypothetical protein